VLDALSGLSESARRGLARAARERILAQHTAEHRALSLEAELTGALRRRHGARRPVLAAGA
jgi:spore maturation protein CgeB